MIFDALWIGVLALICLAITLVCFIGTIITTIEMFAALMGYPHLISGPLIRWLIPESASS